MELPDKLFKRRDPGKQPEYNHYDIVVTAGYIKVEHYKRKAEQINWNKADETGLVSITANYNPLDGKPRPKSQIKQLIILSRH